MNIKKKFSFFSSDFWDKFEKLHEAEFKEAGIDVKDKEWGYLGK
jgi:hypothetical protein